MPLSLLYLTMSEAFASPWPALWTYFKWTTNLSKVLFNSLKITMWLLALHVDGCCSRWMKGRWVSVVEFHDWALGIGKVFGQESTVVKWNYQVLGLHQVRVCQKLGVISARKWFKNWSQLKMVLTKKVCLNWYSSMISLCFRKIWMIFDIENSLWKSKIVTFWQTVTKWRLKIW